MERLKSIANEMVMDEKPFVYRKEEEMTELAETGMVEVNAALTNDEGEVAVRITDDGLKVLKEAEQPVEETEPITTEEFVESVQDVAEEAIDESNVEIMKVGDTCFEVESNIPIPAKLKQKRKPRYPFDEMDVNDSFHVAVSEKKPNPAKSLASTVSAANRRNEDKTFKVFPVDESDPKGPGARVFRIK